MRIYVAGRMSDPRSLRRIRETMALAGAHGHDALDWTSLPDNGPDEDLSPEASRRIAARERKELLGADLMILFYEDAMLGALIEAGIAIAAGVPLWIVPCGGRASIWWHLPGVEFVSRLSLAERLA